MFQVIILCNLKEKQLTKLEKIAKNIISGWFFARFTQIWAPQFFSWVLPLLDVRHCCKLSLYALSRKSMIQTQENDKKPDFGPGHSQFKVI